MASVAEVRLWGRSIGAVSLEDGARVAAFQYAPAFVASGIQLSPVVMPLSTQVYQFPSLPEVSFLGLPGLLADSLPDRFGNVRSEEHTSELQSQSNLVCRLLLAKK